MAGWCTSTQRSRWILTVEDLVKLRREANNKGAAAVVQAYEAVEQQAKLLAAVQEDPADGESAAGAKRKRSKEGGPEPLSPEEERDLCKFYEWKIVEVCKAFQFPPKIQSTAMQYFKRFYLRHSVMEFEPKSIMLTVVFVACKIDEAYVSADALGKGINQNPQLVLNNELVVLQALDFDLITHGPYKPLNGLLADWQARSPELFSSRADGQAASTFDVARELAMAKIPSILATDAPLRFAPAHLALAALKLGFASSSRVDLLTHFSEYLSSLTKTAPKPDQSEPLEAIIQRIEETVDKEGKQPEEGKVKKIDKKLRYCKDPSLRQDEMKRKKEKSKSKRASHEPNLGMAQVAPVG